MIFDVRFGEFLRLRVNWMKQDMIAFSPSFCQRAAGLCLFFIMRPGINLQSRVNTGIFIMVLVGIISALCYGSNGTRQSTAFLASPDFLWDADEQVLS